MSIFEFYLEWMPFYVYWLFSMTFLRITFLRAFWKCLILTWSSLLCFLSLSFSHIPIFPNVEWLPPGSLCTGHKTSAYIDIPDPQWHRGYKKPSHQVRRFIGTRLCQWGSSKENAFILNISPGKAVRASFPSPPFLPSSADLTSSSPPSEKWCIETFTIF